MTIKMKYIAAVTVSLACLALNVAYSSTVINNNTTPQYGPPPSPCGGSTPDPRVPPAGVYTTQNGDGSSQTVYTTGETKPYNADNSGCNNNNNMMPPIVQPNIYPPIMGNDSGHNNIIRR